MSEYECATCRQSLVLIFPAVSFLYTEHCWLSKLAADRARPGAGKEAKAAADGARGAAAADGEPSEELVLAAQLLPVAQQFQMDTLVQLCEDSLHSVSVKDLAAIVLRAQKQRG